MSFLDNFERKGLFRFTRVLALLIIGLLIVGVVVVAIFLSPALITTSKHIDPATVLTAIKSPHTPDNSTSSSQNDAAATADSLPGLKIPSALQSYFDVSGLRGVMTRSGMSLADQQEYLDNMGQVADAAKGAGLKEDEAIDTYLRMKDERIRAIAVQKAEAPQTRIYILATAGSALGLIGLFNLILVLLAIERNTRVRSREPDV